MHLVKNPVENIIPQNVDEVNTYPKEILISNLSAVQMEADELEVANLLFRVMNEDDMNEDEEDVSIEFADQFNEESGMSSTERITYNEMHLIRNTSENVRPQNVEVNESPNENVMRDLSKSFEDNDTSTIVITGDFYSAKRFNCSAQGLFYVLGYIAKKLKEKCPTLGKPTGKMTQSERDDSLCTWLLSISNGKLFEPSPEFLKDGQDMENEFINFHACSKRVDMKPKVIDRFTDVLVEKFGDTYDREVLALFAKTRTHIRIKDLNKALIRREAHSLSMRDLKQQGQLVYYKLAEEFFNS